MSSKVPQDVLAEDHCDSNPTEGRSRFDEHRGDPLKAVPAVAPATAGYVWYVVALLSIVNVFNYMDRMALAVLMPSIKAELHLSDGQLGLLIGLAFSLFYAICGLPIARWADRGVRRDIIAIALATWSAMTALSGAAQNFWHLFLARVGVGAGEAGCLPPAQSIICDYVLLSKRPGIFAIHNCGIYAGMMLGMILAGWLGDVLGWRWTFVVLGLPGILLALVVRATLIEPKRGSLDAAIEDKDGLSLSETLKELWCRRTYRLLTYYLVVNGFVQYALIQWLPSFYTRTFGLSLSYIGVYLGMAVGAGSGIGLMTGGWLANRTGRSNVRSPLIIGAVAILFAIPVCLTALFVPSADTSLLLILSTAVLWSVPVGPVIATVYSVVKPRMRATAGAINIFATSVLGFGLGPFSVGLLSDYLAATVGHESLRFALIAPVCLLPLMAITLWRTVSSLVMDLRAAGTQF